MAFKTDLTAHEAFTAAKTVARDRKQDAVNIRAQSEAGTLAAATLLGFFGRLNAAVTNLTSYAAVPGIAAYARAQYDNEQYDVAAEFTAMLAVMTDTRDWIVANFPASGGYIQREQISASGVVDRVFSANATASLRTELDALIATIG